MRDKINKNARKEFKFYDITYKMGERYLRITPFLCIISSTFYLLPVIVLTYNKNIESEEIGNEQSL